MKISKKNVIAAYQTASDEQKQLLEDLFGKEIFKPKNVMERIKTFEDACKELGDEHPLFVEYDIATERQGVFSKDLIAYLKLRIITAALNEGWKPTFDKDEWRYFPWFYIYSKEELDEMTEEERSRVVGRAVNNAGASGGIVYASAYSASSHSYAYSGSRLAFKTEELAVYCGKQFIDIWADYVC